MRGSAYTGPQMYGEKLQMCGPFVPEEGPVQSKASKDSIVHASNGQNVSVSATYRKSTGFRKMTAYTDGHYSVRTSSAVTNFARSKSFRNVDIVLQLALNVVCVSTCSSHTVSEQAWASTYLP